MVTDRPYNPHRTCGKLDHKMGCDCDLKTPLDRAVSEAMAKEGVRWAEKTLNLLLQEKDAEIERLRSIISEYESVTYLGRNRKP